MKYAAFIEADTEKVILLFTEVFSDSEGEAEGNVIGELVSNLISDTPASDLLGFTAYDNDVLVGCIFFSRFIVPSHRSAFILSPVAVATTAQGTGVGQALIAYGLEKLKLSKVALAFTYGDPAYYCKTGFQKISEDMVKAPYPLSQPIGWLGQSIDGTPMEHLDGPTQCVSALSHSKYW